MHIVLLTHHYEPEVGAPQRRWTAFVRRFVAQGHRVSVLAPPPHYPLGVVDGELAPSLRPGARAPGRWGETIYRVKFREHSLGLASRSLDQAVAAVDSLQRGLRELTRRGNRPDVIIATAPGLPTIPAGRVLGSLVRTPVVVEMRDAWPDLIGPSGMMGPDDQRSGTARRLIATAHRSITYLQRHAHRVVTTTESFARVLRERGVNQVDVVRNGSSVELLPVLEPPPQRPGLNVLYLGTMGRSQGLRTAIEAAALAARDGVNLNLRFVGSGAEEAELREYAAALAAPVHFHGRVPATEIGEQYAWADTALVSLRDWAPFHWTIPSKLYEAMAVGRHVSGVLDGEAAGIVREASAGFVTPPENAEALARAWAGLAADRAQLDVGHQPRTWVMHHAHHDLLAADYLRILAEVAAR